jgi:hypothetical protein
VVQREQREQQWFQREQRTSSEQRELTREQRGFNVNNDEQRWFLFVFQRPFLSMVLMVFFDNFNVVNSNFLVVNVNNVVSCVLDEFL